MKSLAFLLTVLMFAGWSEAGPPCKIVHVVGPGNQKFVKLNSHPVCFGAKGNDYGQFKAAKGGKLRKIKLVHLKGYVACTGPAPVYWSH